MEPLFKTTSQYTFEEYKKFNNTIMKKNHAIAFFLAILILALLCGIIFKNNYYILFAVIYPIYLIISIKLSTKKMYNSNKVIQNANVDFEFYEDHFEEKDSVSTCNLTYDKLSDMIETKTNFYLMISKNQGFILAKEKFPEGLEDFLKKKKASL